ncbi:hypothetical protein L873DRAFT_1790790 [Choiromyces venosus 120613-1]|uniref:C3H1-type domain-containing protein n=1 Tax=Choiromyces venosus 120613-1 TaxID=1336337 RepID=A0A3N4JH75_9PEZI|nr:hypothetical protein L873DRAFT_1790790 [Choiromyces venosus 120613-1]
MQRTGRGGRGGGPMSEPTEIISEAWKLPIKELPPAAKTTPTGGWEIPPPRTYAIPFWVKELDVDLPKWMFDANGNLMDDLRWDDWGSGYILEDYVEVFWDGTPSTGSSRSAGFSGFSGGGGGVCRSYQTTGNCSFGDRCRFSHDQDGSGQRQFVLPERPQGGGRGGRGGGGWARPERETGGGRGGRGDGGGGGGRGGRGDYGGRGGGRGDGGARGGRGGRGRGGGGGICRFYSTAQGCKFGAECSQRHE